MRDGILLLGALLLAGCATTSGERLTKAAQLQERGRWERSLREADEVVLACAGRVAAKERDEQVCAQALLLKGRAEARTGRAEKALACLDELELRGDAGRAQTLRGLEGAALRAALLARARALAGKAEFGRAWVELARAAGLGTPAAADLALEGDVLTGLWDYAGALAAYEKGLELDAACAPAQGSLARARVRAGAWDERGLAAARAQRQADPADREARWLEGVCLVGVGRPGEALALAPSVEPPWLGHLLVAAAQHRAGNEGEAHAAVTRALSLDDFAAVLQVRASRGFDWVPAEWLHEGLRGWRRRPDDYRRWSERIFGVARSGPPGGTAQFLYAQDALAGDGRGGRTPARYAEAIDALTAARRDDPVVARDPEALLERAISQFLAAGWAPPPGRRPRTAAQLAVGDVLEAMAQDADLVARWQWEKTPVLAHLSRAEPRAPQALEALARARRLAAAGSHAEAIAVLDGALEIAPGFARLLVARAQARTRAGDAAGGVADCDDALSFRPDERDAHSARGFARLRAGDAAGAARDLDIAISRGSEAVDDRVHRGLARQRLGDLAGALADLDAALRREQGERRDFAPVHAARATLLLALKRVPEALTAARRALERDPGLAGAHYTVALVHAGARDKHAALYELGAAVDADASFAAAARAEPAFEWLRGDGEFREVVGAK